MGSKHGQRETRPMPGENDRGASQSEWCVVAVHISVGKLHGRGVISLRREQFDALDEEGRDVLTETVVGGAFEEAARLLSFEILTQRAERKVDDDSEVY